MQRRQALVLVLVAVAALVPLLEGPSLGEDDGEAAGAAHATPDDGSARPAEPDGGR